MTEDDIYPLLATLAGGKVYPYVAPLDNDDKPSICKRRLSTVWSRIQDPVT
ncbi:hypothetical protein [Enterobacter asburiae]|uniref:hypothetical protein n=1 Tax=Enterobacter asburiae TaxID=61645 RepID=UPI001BCA81E7|nr:hypothetical protein [Enterobacter asburiae]